MLKNLLKCKNINEVYHEFFYSRFALTDLSFMSCVLLIQL